MKISSFYKLSSEFTLYSTESPLFLFKGRFVRHCSTKSDSFKELEYLKKAHTINLKTKDLLDHVLRNLNDISRVERACKPVQNAKGNIVDFLRFLDDDLSQIKSRIDDLKK